MRKYLRYGAVGLSGGFLTALTAFLILSSGLPDPAIFANRQINQSTKIYDRAGETLLYEIYGEYGFYDSVRVKTGKVAKKYLALDQAMILIALNNYLNNGAIRKRFHQDPIAKKAEPLLTEEKLFENVAAKERSVQVKPVAQVSKS